MGDRSWIFAATLLVVAAFGVAHAQQPVPAPAAPPAAAPPFAITKVEGTENVYIFRAGGHQSMFVVTSAGVIATDPIGYGRPLMVQTYVDEIKKVTNQPIKWVIYSHHHFDHIAGRPGDGLGPVDSRPPRPARRAAWHQGRRAAAAGAHAGGPPR